MGERITQTGADFKTRMEQRVAELAKGDQLDTGSRLRFYKRVADGFAQDLNDFASRSQTETPIFENLVATGADAIARAAPIVLAIGPNQKHEIQPLLPGIRASAKALLEPIDAIRGFQQTMNSFPGVTTRLNQSRTRLIGITEGFIKAISDAHQQLLNLADTLEKLTRE